MPFGLRHFGSVMPEITLGPLGLKLDCEQIEATRPQIAEMLRQNQE
jgi:hypothetical protein